jgi:hypothetical protein
MARNLARDGLYLDGSLDGGVAQANTQGSDTPGHSPCLHRPNLLSQSETFGFGPQPARDLATEYTL